MTKLKHVSLEFKVEIAKLMMEQNYNDHQACVASGAGTTTARLALKGHLDYRPDPVAPLMVLGRAVRVASGKQRLRLKLRIGSICLRLVDEGPQFLLLGRPTSTSKHYHRETISELPGRPLAVSLSTGN